MELRALAEALRREGELDGPVLLLRQNDLRASFNPNELVPMDDEGTYYPPGPFRPPGAA